MKAAGMHKPTYYIGKLGQVYQVFLDSKRVFHGTKKQCEKFVRDNPK